VDHQIEPHEPRFARHRPRTCGDILNGFNAYFGTYQIDESSESVIHRVEGSLLPSWVGAELRRRYEFSGNDRLILSAISSETVNRLVWQREMS
jgi:hypothetical protein